ncbi:MAG TPA: tetratricopeptide repeat protein [Candidatus Binatia bacterium]|nr:tetratricopeptide repeat protein [Candidatus Binatia bacterium]
MNAARIGCVVAALALAACGPRIKEGEKIEDLAGKDRPASQPVAPTGPIKADSQRAVDNYRKLLDLPQDPATRAETLRRLADLQLDTDETGGGTVAESDQRLGESVALYTTLLREQPDAPGNDRVLYQLARAYQNLGETAKAEEALQRMLKQYPRSEYADDARFRRAELLFKLAQYDDAAAEYRRLLEVKESPFFETAQYKYGWALFKLGRYDEALGVFLVVLDRELPAGEQSDEEAALAGARPGKKDLARESLRVASLTLGYLGGGDAARQYFAAHREPGYAPLLYRKLADSLLEKKRFTDAAHAYTAFIDAHPRHALAPLFQSRAIAAEEAGGFSELVVQEKERYARSFDPAAAYWSGRTPPPEVLAELHGHLDDLARFYQARGQKTRAGGSGDGRGDSATAAQRYRRLLELFPHDAKAAETRFLMAESLFDAGQTLASAAEYERVATENPGYEKAPDAAYAALLAYERNATEVPEAQRTDALKRAVAAALALADRYPKHPQALAALTRAAEDQYKLQDFDAAARTAARVIDADPRAPDELRHTALAVAADAQFSRKDYAAAETAYTAVLKQETLKPEERQTAGERLAASIYKQGEALRAAGNQKGAAEAFLRVGRAVPSAGIRATAEYDAAAALIAAQDWSAAATVLEAFRAAYAASPLLGDADKKLAVAYQNAGRPREAAAVLERIAGRPGESAATRNDAAWLAVSLLDKAGDARTERAYEDYLRQFPEPAERAIAARQRLLELAAAGGNEALRLERLRQIVAADAAAGTHTDAGRLAAARATLELGRVEARKASQLSLHLPLKASLAARKEATERAVTTLTHAADSGFADVTPAATYELGQLYRELARALLNSERPKKLSALELEQYNVLLEEQAFPFEEKSIRFHEANLQRVQQGTYSDWIGRSLQALAELAPGKYAKRERTAEAYDALR